LRSLIALKIAGPGKSLPAQTAKPEKTRRRMSTRTTGSSE